MSARSEVASAQAADSRSSLLDRFPEETRVRWAAHLLPVNVRSKTVLQTAGARIDHLYFPTTAVVVQMRASGRAESMGVACCGDDSVVGVCAVLGAGAADYTAVVLKPGLVLRLKVEHLTAEMECVAATRRLALWCVQAHISDLAQSVVCSQFHLLEGRLATRLLQLVGKAAPVAMELTQDTLGHFLGTRRERVNQVTREWQGLGLIECGRGWLRVVDRTGLAEKACACHAVMARGL